MVALVVSMISAWASSRGAHLTAETEQERIDLTVWKESVAELRKQLKSLREQHDAEVIELRDEAKSCHARNDELTDELSGMRAGNHAMRLRMAIMEAQLESVTGRKLPQTGGGQDAVDDS